MSVRIIRHSLLNETARAEDETSGSYRKGGNVYLKSQFSLLGLLLFLLWSPASARDIALTITSDPPGARVTWNDRFVGTTPYSAKFPGGYFHQTEWVTSKVLRTAVNVVLSKPGYEPQRFAITEGPYERKNLKGQSFGEFWIIMDKQFHRVLDPERPPVQDVRPTALGPIEPKAAPVKVSKPLLAFMLQRLGRCKDSLQVYDELQKTTDPWAQSCKHDVEGAQSDILKYSSDDEIVGRALYMLGRYQDALGKVNSEVEIQADLLRTVLARPKYNPPAVVASIAYPLSEDLQYRGLINAALGKLSPALQDFDQAESVRSRNDRDRAFFLGGLYIQRAIILYMNGKLTESTNACAKALDWDGLNYNQDLCAAIRREQMQPEATGTPSRQSDIEGEIESIIRDGQYAPMPEPQITPVNNSGATSARRIFRNDTAYMLHVFTSGPMDLRLDLPPGGSSTVDLPPGSYRIAARADLATVQSFYGVQVLEAGVQYAIHFAVSSR